MARPDDSPQDAARRIPAAGGVLREHYEERWRAIAEAGGPPGEPERFGARLAFLLEHVRPGDAVLDVGSGRGAFTRALAGAGAAPVGADVAEAALALARAEAPALEWVLVPPDGPLPLEDGRFDVVWAGEVLEHVADTATLLSEVRRVLASGGTLVLSTPDHPLARRAAVALLPGAFERHFDPRGEHLRFYTRRGLRALLADFGFEDVRVRGLGGLPPARATILVAATRAGLNVRGRPARPASRR